MQPKLWEQVPPHWRNCLRPIGGARSARRAKAPSAWRRLRYRRGVSSRATVTTSFACTTAGGAPGRCRSSSPGVISIPPVISRKEDCLIAEYTAALVSLKAPVSRSQTLDESLVTQDYVRCIYRPYLFVSRHGVGRRKNDN